MFSVVLAVFVLSSAFVFTSAVAAEPVSASEWLSKAVKFLGGITGFQVSEDGSGSVAPSKPACTDSDGGEIFDVKGTVSIANNPNPYTDFCFNSGAEVTEYYCWSDGTLTLVTYPCPNGCKDGACISKVSDEQVIGNIDLAVGGVSVTNNAGVGGRSTMSYSVKNAGTGPISSKHSAVVDINFGDGYIASEVIDVGESGYLQFGVGEAKTGQTSHTYVKAGIYKILAKLSFTEDTNPANNEASTTLTIVEGVPSCKTLDTRMSKASDGTGYIGCDVEVTGAFDLSRSYCAGQKTGKRSSLIADGYGRANRYYATLAGLDLAEEVKVFVAAKSGEEVECLPSLNKVALATPKPSCTDSDGGKAYYVTGTATGAYYDMRSQLSQFSFTDFCSSDPSDPINTLIEYYCDGQDIKSSHFICQNGCKDGACLTTAPKATKCPSSMKLVPGKYSYTQSETAEFKIYMYDVAGAIVRRGASLDVKTADGSLMYGKAFAATDSGIITVTIPLSGYEIGSYVVQASSEAGDCPSRFSDKHSISIVTSSVKPSCTDSDGGKDYDKKGVGTGIYVGSIGHGIYGQEPNPDVPKNTDKPYSTFYDYCPYYEGSQNQLNEAYCDSDKLSAVGITCLRGCVQGRCETDDDVIATEDGLVTKNDYLVVSAKNGKRVFRYLSALASRESSSRIELQDIETGSSINLDYQPVPGEPGIGVEDASLRYGDGVFRIWNASSDTSSNFNLRIDLNGDGRLEGIPQTYICGNSVCEKGEATECIAACKPGQDPCPLAPCHEGSCPKDCQTASQTGYDSASWTCHDGTVGAIEEAIEENHAACYLEQDLWQKARDSCSGHCSKETGKCGLNSFTLGRECEMTTEQHKCTDSDGGLNYDVAGKTTGVYGGNYGFTYDYCSEGGSDDAGNKVNLIEFYCIDKTDYGAKPYFCPSGCSDGACVKEKPAVTEYNVEIATGWNLVNAMPIMAQGKYGSSSCSWLQGDLDTESAAYLKRNMFSYDPLKNKYVSVGELGAIDSLPANGGYLVHTYINGFWLRSREECSITLNVPADFNPDILSIIAKRDYKLAKGWNFFSVWPEMTGRTLEDINGDCNIIRAYGYDASQPQWINLKGIEFDHDAVWHGIIMKVAADCTLGASVGAPPPLPMEEEQLAVPQATKVAATARSAKTLFR